MSAHMTEMEPESEFRFYPHMLNSLVLLFKGGVLVKLIALLVRAIQSRWSSNGVVFFIGLLPGSAAVTGFGNTSHLTDELPKARKQVPQVMVGGAFFCSLSGISMILAYMFCIVKPENQLAPVAGQPIIQLMLDAFDSQSLTIIGTIAFILGFGSTCATFMTTLTRCWWTFARANGVAFSGTMAKVNDYWRLSVNAISCCVALVLCLGLIELGSSTALNAVIGGLILCIYSLYCLPIISLLISRRRCMQTEHYMNLGNFGYTLNVYAV